MAVTTARADLKTSLTSGRGKLSTGSPTHKANRRTREEKTSGTEEHRGIEGTRRTTGRKNGRRTKKEEQGKKEKRGNRGKNGKEVTRENVEHG